MKKNKEYLKKIMDGEKGLRQAIKMALPKADEMGKTATADAVLFHQDAFAADYQIEEYILLGMFIKYIGLSGKEIRIIGKNRETIDK